MISGVQSVDVVDEAVHAGMRCPSVWAQSTHEIRSAVRLKLGSVVADFLLKELKECT